MNRRWRPLATLVLGVCAMVAMQGTAPGAADGPAFDAGDREELLARAASTWHSFERMVGPSGLPADLLRRTGEGAWAPSKQTTPTDIASYLWATLGARALGLVDDAEADRRVGATLAMLGRLERHRGFFYGRYEVETGARTDVTGDDPAIRGFLSSVDNGWLAAALMMVGNARPPLRGAAEALLGPMDFGFFYVPFDPDRPVDRPGQFHGGYDPLAGTFTTFYGMLNTEPRIISYVAIARGQVPAEHYYRLFRTPPPGRGPQRQTPRGETRTYLGVPVFEGHYRFRDLDVVPSWGGSMFEALMVPLFVPEELWGPASWGVNHPLYARAQLEQGLEVKRYGYWGFSPSRVPEGGYQTYGVDDLGADVDGYHSYEVAPRVATAPGASCGPACAGVVTPHASFLALRYLPREALANLRALAKAFPVLGPGGYYDSVNVATGKVSDCVLALDQGMILAAIANALADDALRRAFADGRVEAAIRPLLAPEVFSAGDRR